MTSILSNRSRPGPGRLVSLATILINIRTTQDAPKPVEKAAGIGDYFVTNVTSAWDGALRALSDTAAFLIRVIVGGLVWWIVGAIVMIALYRWAARALPRRGREPVPLG